MSETVHYRGVATRIEQPNNKTLMEVAEGILKERNKQIDDYYKDAIECLCDEFYGEYFYYPATQTLYSITKEELDAYDDIIIADKKEDGTIEYELKYYNGGVGFDECLEEAFDKLLK